MATNILKGQKSEWTLMKRHVSEDIFGVQICGAKVDHVVRCAEVIGNELDVDFVDLNTGCPIDLVFSKVCNGNREPFVCLFETAIVR